MNQPFLCGGLILSYMKNAQETQKLLHLIWNFLGISVQ